MATLLLYGALLRYTIARPTSPASASIPSSEDSPSVYAAPSDAPTFDTNYRSTVEIVWSCLTVIIASSWLCVHPNVTGVRTTMWQRLRERLLLFTIAIFAPEVMAVFAYYQWIGCRKLYKGFEQRAKGLGIILLPQSRFSTPGSSTETLNNANGQVDETPDHPHSAGLAAPSSEEESEHLVKQEAHDEVGRRSALQRIWKGLWSPFKRISCVVLSIGTDPKEATWSYTHAHFVQMGGIAFRKTDGHVGFKSPKHWTDEELKAFFALNLTEADISDKSKAGALAKTLVIARVLWFLIHAVARKIQGLPIALLEVASLAFIAFNISMYLFWWNKPLDVDVSLKIRGNPGGKHTLSVRDQLILVVNMLLGQLDNIPIGSWLYSSKRQRYPRFYSFGKRVELLRQSGSANPELDRTLALSIAVVSSAFGAFHTIGWYLPAPTHVARTLWRVACLVLTLYPLLLIPMVFLFLKLVRFTNSHPKYHLHWIAIPLSLTIGIPCAIAYIGARLTVFFLPFFELRSLPPLIHRTVSWYRFLSPI